MPEIKNQAQWLLPITQFQTQFIHPCLHSLIHEIFPLKQWMENLQVQLAGHLAILHTRGICVPQTLPIVLEVDDNAFDRKVVKQLLACEYYDLIFAASSAEALGILRKKRPDLILMDVNMPEINGLETLHRLKAMPRFANIPVMMLTGQRDKDVVLDCLRKGAIDFVIKPLDPDIFLKKVTKYVMV